MSTPDDPADHGRDDGRDANPLGSAASRPSGDDDADGMAGPVYPPPETEPDAHGHGSSD